MRESQDFDWFASLDMISSCESLDLLMLLINEDAILLSGRQRLLGLIVVRDQDTWLASSDERLSVSSSIRDVIGLVIVSAN